MPPGGMLSCVPPTVGVLKQAGRAWSQGRSGPAGRAAAAHGGWARRAKGTGLRARGRQARAARRAGPGRARGEAWERGPRPATPRGGGGRAPAREVFTTVCCGGTAESVTVSVTAQLRGRGTSRGRGGGRGAVGPWRRRPMARASAAARGPCRARGGRRGAASRGPGPGRALGGLPPRGPARLEGRFFPGGRRGGAQRT
jgi:hypothetical protein